MEENKNVEKIPLLAENTVDSIVKTKSGNELPEGEIRTTYGTFILKASENKMTLQESKPKEELKEIEIKEGPKESKNKGELMITITKTNTFAENVYAGTIFIGKKVFSALGHKDTFEQVRDSTEGVLGLKSI